MVENRLEHGKVDQVLVDEQILQIVELLWTGVRIRLAQASEDQRADAPVHALDEGVLLERQIAHRKQGCRFFVQFDDVVIGLDIFGNVHSRDCVTAQARQDRMRNAPGLADFPDRPDNGVGIFLHAVVNAALVELARVVDTEPAANVDVLDWQAQRPELRVDLCNLLGRLLELHDLRHLAAQVKMQQLELMSRPTAL